MTQQNNVSTTHKISGAGGDAEINCDRSAPAQDLIQEAAKNPRKGAFLPKALAIVKDISAKLRALSKAESDASKGEITAGLQSKAEKIVTICEEAGWPILKAFVLALSKMTKLINANPERINVSSLRTAANAVDFLTGALTSSVDLSSVEKKPLKALVIDDNETCRQAMVLALKSENLEVRAASDGREALEMLREDAQDVVFTDIQMPGVDGFELIKTLRSLPNHGQTPVVFVTALSDFETRSKSILSGGCDMLAKPITPSEVLLKAFTFALRGRFPELLKRGAQPEQSHGSVEKTSRTPCERAIPAERPTDSSGSQTLSLAVTQTLEEVRVRLQTQIREQYTEERQLHEKIAIVEADLAKLKGRRAALEVEIDLKQGLLDRVVSNLEGLKAGRSED